MPPPAIPTTNTTIPVAKKNGSGGAVESSVKSPKADEDSKKATEAGVQEEEKKH